MLVAAAFCPQPPLLVPALAGGAAGEFDALRAACDEAVRRLLAAVGTGRLAVLASGDAPAGHPGGGRASTAGFGVDVPLRLGAGTGQLPLALGLAGWLLERAGPHAAPFGLLAGPGGDLPAVPDDLAGVLVMGDGSAYRDPGGALGGDPRAEPFDDAVAAALGSGDPTRLAAVDPALGGQLLAAGAPAWRAASRLLAGGRYRAELLHHGAPHGVTYLVASWSRR